MKLKQNDALMVALGLSRQPDDEIVPYIDRWLVEHGNAGLYEVDDRPYNRSVADVRKTHFHPSGDCLKCPRLLYLERDPEHVSEVQEDFGPKTLRIFKMGDAVHAMIQAWFAAMDSVEGYPDLVGNEYRFVDEKYNVGGFIDSVVKFPGSDAPVAIEIKSIGDYQFKLLKSPKAAHKMQVGTYIMELDAPFGIVLYMNKNTSEMKEFRVDPVDMMPVLSKWSRVRLAIEAGDITQLECGCRVGDGDDVTFKRCPAKDICAAMKAAGR